ncbi:hypothetical protein P1X14_20995 [Sphingomonas sp. AOB5]|uniref:hypothetical protein n=1 Tax=Sphingomonas sp. AOB5 TaxID=3034017 RepID=UPI0023F8CFD7|nr:hypothetical protein [Sphingomonas sp. AOB5]MDF7777746.1 hypothetical protein [Sphingomonas sp. AOB5]
MRRSLLTSALLAAPLLIALPAAAQNRVPPASDDEIIVEGGRNQPTRAKQAADFVQELTVVAGVDPLARFDRTELCPAVVGLSERHNAAVTERMRRVAEAANVPLAEPGCKPNALVVIAPDKEEMISAMKRAYPTFFRLPTNKVVKIPRQDGPATAWHLGGYVDREGQPISYSPDDNFFVLSSTTTPSRLSSPVRPVFLASVVVIQRDSLEGLTTTQVGDYAAMRAYTGADPARLRRSTAPTILNILDSTMDSEIPITLTPWDLAFLRALYSVPANHYGRRQQTEMRRRMVDELEKGPPHS